MSKTDSTKVLWLIQFRTAKDRPWRNRAGRFETRATARRIAKDLQKYSFKSAYELPTEPGYGFGNTRVVRVVKGA